MPKYTLKYTGEEINEILEQANSSFKPGDFKLTQSEEQPPEWLKCDGSMYDKSDYPSLEHLSVAGVYSESPSVIKFGDYYVRSFGRVFTYYPTLNDCIKGTNGKSVTVTTDSTTYSSLTYGAYSPVNGGLYAIGGDGGVLWTSTTINGQYTSHSLSTSIDKDDDVDSICGTKYGIYARIWDDSNEREYAVFINSNTGSLGTITYGSLDDIQATSDGEYAIIGVYQSGSTYVCQGSTSKSVSLPITGTLSERHYSVEEGVWYVISYSGSSGSRTNYILRCKKDIAGNNVDGGSYEVVYNSGTVADRWSGSYLMGSHNGYVFIVDSASSKSTRIIKEGKIIASLPTTALSFKYYFDDNNKIYCGSYRIDFNKFNVPTLKSDFGTYYILS